MSLEDPFFVVKDEVTQSIKNAEGLYQRWKELLANPSTAGGQEYDWVTQELKNGIKSIEWDLEDLEETIRAVERNPEKFRIDAREITTRKAFVTETKQKVKAVRDDLNSAATKSKVEQTKRKDLMGGNGGAASASSSKGRYARLDNELERNNQDFIEDQFQQQQTVMKEQDEQLELVGQSVGVLKQMGEQIGNELDDQAVMLDDLDQDLDNTQSKLTGVRKTVDRVIKMADDKKQCCIIITLIVVVLIIVILFVAT
ncbi:syntaxin-6-like [Oscarella lobularis]|uniref:syntaxin-6-like n=1 Tax=Oscarella lobularis TaxID=121494 RepID=UPI0033131071